MSGKNIVKIRVYGALSLSFSDDEDIQIRSRKAQVILPLLATAPDGRRTRAWLQEKLWSRVGPEQASGSLRQAMFALRRALGPSYDGIIETSGSDIRLVPQSWSLVGTPEDGEFLEGMDLREEGLEDWLRTQRNGATVAPQMPAFAIQPVEESFVPRISILPFQHVMSGNAQSTVLGDMFAEEMTRNLARTNIFDVISHLSARTFVDRAIADIQRVSTELAADYIASGTIRIHGDSFRLDLDVTDVAANRVLSSEVLTGSVKAFIQGDTQTLIDALEFVVRCTMNASLSACRSRALPELKSHAVLLSALGLMHRNDLGHFSQSRVLLEELRERHPKETILNVWLAQWYVISATQGWSDQPKEAARRAGELTYRALNDQPNCSFAASMDGFVHTYLLHDFDTGFQRFDDALSMDRSSALACLFKGVSAAFTGNGQAAVELTERANMLAPLDPQKYFYETLTATAYLSAGEYDTALRLAERALDRNPRHFSTYRVKSIALFGLGRMEEAKASAADLLRRDKNFTIQSYLQSHPAASFETGRIWADALRACDIPET